MRTKLAVAGLFVSLLAWTAGAALLAQSAPVPAAPHATPTFTKDVASIVFASCAGCHRPGETAPMSLLSYEEVRPWARAIRRAVTSREMPPWHVDRRHGVFKDDPSLSDEQIQIISRWVDAGAPRGRESDLPPVPTFATGWRGGQPDYVFEMPIDYPVPAEGQVDVLHFWIPVPWAEDRLVEALEFRPGNSAVVHHARADVVELPKGLKVVDGSLFKLDGRPDDGLDDAGNRRDSFDGDDGNHHLVAFVPGRGYERHHPGTAKRIEAGKWMRLELHYNANGTATTDRSKVGVWFAKQPAVREIYTRSVGQPLSRNGDISDTQLFAQGKEIVPQPGPDGRLVRPRLPNIPPHTDNWQVKAMTFVTEPITLFALSPHMHLRGKDLTWVVTWPDGREETIMRVPAYDYNWQLNYKFETPLRIPPGSKVTAIAHWDNTANNKYNPAPDKEVPFASQSWDEMLSPFWEFTKDEENLLTNTRVANPRQQ